MRINLLKPGGSSAVCIGLFAAGLLAGCSKSEPAVSVEERKAVDFEITAGPPTRVSITDDYLTEFVDGDELGVFVTKDVEGSDPGLQPSDNYADNVKMRYSGLTGNWSIDGQPVYWPGDEEKLRFYFYYPYREEVEDATAIMFSVLEDQSAREAFDRSYVMFQRADAGYYDEVVNVKLLYFMNLFEVEIVEAPYNRGLFENGVEAYVGQAYRTMGIDISAMTPVWPAEPEARTAIKMLRVETDPDATTYTYRALVRSSSIIVAGEPLFTFEIGDHTIVYNTPQDITDTSNGRVYRYKLTVTDNL